MRRPVLYIGDILAWIDALKERVGRWPRRDDGKIIGQLGLTWTAVDQALKKGHRGLPKGLSLAKLLKEHRGVRHRNFLPPLHVDQILTWADAHHLRTNEWPSDNSGPVTEAPGETWMAVHANLRQGGRGLPGGSSLAQLLLEERGVRHHLRLPRLTPKQVLRWADAHHARTGRWPRVTSGCIPDASGETWHAVAAAFVAGSRGLNGNGSLAQLLARTRGVRNRKALPKLPIERIRTWARAFHRRTGRWPRHTDGAIPGTGGETWSGVHSALVRGSRGFPGGSSLYRIIRPLRRTKKREGLARATNSAASRIGQRR